MKIKEIKVSDRQVEALLLLYNRPFLTPRGFAWKFWLDNMEPMGSKRRGGYFRAAGSYLSKLRTKKLVGENYADGNWEWYLTELGKKVLREKLKEGMEIIYKKDLCLVEKIDKGYIDLDVVDAEGYYRSLPIKEVIDFNI